MKWKILEMLRNTEGYLSGQEICERLHVSRTAVWKIIKQLQEQRYQIEGVKNRGYRLLHVPDIMTAEEIMSRIRTKHLAKRVFYFPIIDSTNLQAKKYAEEPDADGALFLADEQTKGRGRRGRSWNSPAGDNIFMSLLLKPKLCPESASMMTLITALATAAAAEQMTGLEVKIKWPNDIVVNKKKICGILTEMSSEADYIHYLVIGIGINVNTKIFPEELSKTASSLFLEAGAEKRFCRSELICLLLEYLEKYYDQFLSAGNLSFAKEEYNHRLAGRNEYVKVLGTQEELVGISRGITETGELLVELPDGSRKSILSGEVSVRGLYGYI